MITLNLPNEKVVKTDPATGVVTFRGQVMKRHINGGGWVPAEQDKDNLCFPYVDDTVYVGPNALVHDNARLLDEVRIEDEARVGGCVWLFDSVRVFDAARLTGWLRVSDDMQIGGNTCAFKNEQLTR